MNKAALIRDWNRNHRGTPFYLLILGISLAAMLFLFIRRVGTGLVDRNYYFRIYSLLLFIFLPLSQIRSWAWLRSKSAHIPYLSLPLKDSTLVLLLYTAGLVDLLWILCPALLMVLGAPVSILQPGILLLSWLGLFLMGGLLMAISRLANQWSSGPVKALLLSFLMELPVYLFISPSPWSLDYLFAGLFKGSILVFYILLILILLQIQQFCLTRQRYRGDRQ